MLYCCATDRLISAINALEREEGIMSKQKIRWRSIGIPDTLFKKIRKLIVYVGCPSVSEYVREAARAKAEKDAENIELKEIETYE